MEDVAVPVGVGYIKKTAREASVRRRRATRLQGSRGLGWAKLQTVGVKEESWVQGPVQAQGSEKSVPGRRCLLFLVANRDARESA